MKRQIIIIFSLFLIGCGSGGDGHFEISQEDGGMYCAGGTASLLKAYGDINEARRIFNEYFWAFQPADNLNNTLRIVHDGNDDYYLKNAYSIAAADCLINKGYQVAIHIWTKPCSHWMYVDDIWPNDPQTGGYTIRCIESEKNTIGDIIQFITKETDDLVDVIISGRYAGVEINFFMGYMRIFHGICEK